MPTTRRDFIKTGVAAAAVVAMPRPLLVRLGRRPEPVPPIEDPRIKELALGALDAARSAGAAYADVRLTHETELPAGATRPSAETMEVGVRALMNGYWGFASGPLWTPDEMSRLGREAVLQAKVNATGKSRPVELAPVAAVSDGHWTTPVNMNPFETSPLEIRDYLEGLKTFVQETRGAYPSQLDAAFTREDKAFASTTGTFCTQRLYRTFGIVLLSLERNGRSASKRVDELSMAGLGWEYWREQPVRELIRRDLAWLEEQLKLPIKPVEVGRFDAVLTASVVAALVDQTLGYATELDRAMGFEANAGGTSFITDPLTALGTYRCGAPLLTLTANRTEPGGCATVNWDDEGVAPDEFALVKDGVLADFQTTREGAGWLSDWYRRNGRPFRSHGCANAQSAVYAQMEHIPNLAMAPGHEATDFEGLTAGLGNGIAIMNGGIDMDFQHLNGQMRALMLEIKGGKPVAVLNGAGALFRAPEFWKSLMAVGGPASVLRVGKSATKGEPAQATVHSVSAPPAVVKQLTIVDYERRA